MTATVARKPKFDRTKVYYTKSGNGLVTFITDCNRQSRATAEVLQLGENGFNCRIDRNGKPWKYAKNIAVTTPLAAYEYTLLLGDFCGE